MALVPWAPGHLQAHDADCRIGDRVLSIDGVVLDNRPLVAVRRMPHAPAAAPAWHADLAHIPLDYPPRWTTPPATIR